MQDRMFDYYLEALLEARIGCHRASRRSDRKHLEYYRRRYLALQEEVIGFASVN